MSVTEKRLKLTATEDETHAALGGENEWLERGDHPLSNDLILETLFGFVRRFDLKASRVVSKKWNVRTLPHMRATFKVTIRGTHSTASAETDQDARRIDDFVKLFSSNEMGIPFSKFRLQPFRTTEGVGQQFLQLCGETATEIDLSDVKIVYIIEDVSELLRGCPNIEALDLPINLISRSGNVIKLFPTSMPTFSSLKDITFASEYDKEGLKCCPTFIEEMLTAAPNISDISVFEEEGEENGNEDDGRNINVVLNCIENLGRESFIQNLYLNKTTIEDVEHLERMAKNGLNLKSLIILPKSLTQVGVETVQIKLATCFKDSLEYFEVFESVDNILMEFPNMPKLKSLSQRIIRIFEIKGINLNENFPTLETLDFDLEDLSQENWDEYFTAVSPCPTIKSLIVDDNYMKIYMFHNFLVIFPNLTKLELKLKDDGVEVLRNIWIHMPQLESLSVCGDIERTADLYFDSLFTGIPTVVLKYIRHVGDWDYLGRMAEDERRESILYLLNEYSLIPSILHLTKLRHLELHITGDFHLTNLTAFLAFYSMNHLHHLDIEQCEFTKPCCEILTKETGLETWSFQTSNNPEWEYIIPQFLLPDRND